MSVLAGIAATTLHAWLSQAQQAYQDLMVGAKAVTLTYGMGDGQKSVTYHRIDSPKLLAWIGQLQAELRMPGCGRRAMAPRYS